MSSWGWGSHDEISGFIGRGHEKEVTLCHVRRQQGSCPQGRERLSPGTQFARTWNLNFPVPRTVRNSLLFKHLPTPLPIGAWTDNAARCLESMNLNHHLVDKTIHLLVLQHVFSGGPPTKSPWKGSKQAQEGTASSTSICQLVIFYKTPH